MLMRTGPVGANAAMDRLRMRVAAGVSPDDTDTLPERSRRALDVARAVGAPLLDALEGAQAAEDDAARSRRAVAVASAQTRAVATGLVLAPAVLVPGLGRLVGTDLVGFYTSGLGILVLGAGTSLLLVGTLLVVLLVRRVGRAAAHRSRGRHTALVVAVGAGALAWRLSGPVVAPVTALLVHHLLDRRFRPAPPAGIDEAADLTATALTGGVSAPEALRVTADELPQLAHRLRRLAFSLELGMSGEELTGDAHHPERAPTTGAGTTTVGRSGASSPRTRRAPAVTTSAGDGLTRLVGVLSTAEELGAPVVPSLRRLARDLRADELAEVLAAAERLPAQLTFPTALCLLPATVLLVGAPIVHAGLVAAGA